MDKRGANKENKSRGKTMSAITDHFKVKKCLFEPMKLDFSSPKMESPPLLASPNFPINQDDSPFALFRIRKRRSGTQSPSILDKGHEETPQKRTTVTKYKNETTDVVMASPDTSNSVKIAVQKAMTDPTLTGDFSKPCVLPIIVGRHPDLKCISPGTAAELLNGLKSHMFKIIDCRYPYEYQGGHIKHAINMYNKGEAENDFFSSTLVERSVRMESNHILIFYCEFSSERAPSMIRFLRSKDRDLNSDSYPFLFYPELYLIEGGYKAFYSSFKELCEPQEYKTMLDKDCTEELSFYRSQCKSFSMKSKRGKRTKMSLF